MAQTGTSRSPDQLPPHNLEAERAVLGAILLNPELINSALEHLVADDFFQEAHRVVFQAMAVLYEQDRTVDIIGIKDYLSRLNLIDKAGGVEYLAELLDAVPTTGNIDYHCRLVFDKALLRRLIASATTMIAQAYQEVDPTPVILEQAEHELLELSQRRLKGSLAPINQLIGPTFESLSRLFDQRQLITGLETGFPDLDKLTSGLHPGELIVVAARPSIGKTTFGMNVLHHVAMKLNRPVAVFSLEMSAEQLVTRLLCAEAQVDGQKLRSGFLSKKEWPDVTKAVGRLAHAPIYIDDSPAATVYEIRSKARRLKAGSGLDLIMIDYLQLIQARTHYDSRQQEISSISNALKSLAKELALPVIALAQLSREVEKRPGKKPQLADLRESGAIEQDADVVAFLHRPEFYGIPTIEIDGREEPSEGRAQLIIGKQRNGPTGVVNMAFLRNLMQFKPLLSDSPAVQGSR